jgi:hypothetical protein
MTRFCDRLANGGSEENCDEGNGPQFFPAGLAERNNNQQSKVTIINIIESSHRGDGDVKRKVWGISKTRLLVGGRKGPLDKWRKVR